MNLPSARFYVQVEQTVTREPTSENLFQTISGSVNHLLDTQAEYREWTINGPIKTFNGQSFIDGIKSLPPTNNWSIFSVEMWLAVQGTSGSFEIDILRAPYGSTSWTSIFATRPVITSGAAAGVTIFNGDTVSGCTAPVLTASPLSVSAKDKFRLDVLNVQGGSPRNGGARMYFRGR